MRKLLLAACLCGGISITAQSQASGFGAFIQRYSDEWMRFHTNAASSRRYFGGGEQEAMERQIEPVTRAHRLAELQLIDRGLAQLAAFDRSRLDPGDQRIAAII